MLILSLVHPDFLPSVYALSFVLRAEGYRVDVVSFSSPVGTGTDVGPEIFLHDCGPYRGTAWQRCQARKRFRTLAARVAREQRPVAILTTCPFSFLEGIRLRGGGAPLVYYMLETYETRPRDFLRSPLTAMRSRRALRRIAAASLVCTPSWERSGWLAGVTGARRLPATVLNSPSYASTHARRVEPTALARLVPSHLRSRPLVINTGAVSSSQGVLELIRSVSRWPDTLALVVTNVSDNAYGAALRSAAEESPRRESIVLLPTITRQELLALQAAASIGICLLRSGDNLETVMPAPNKIGEYLHNGLMVVGVRMPYLEQLEVAGLAVLAEDLSPDAIAPAVETAWQRSALGDGKARALEAARTWYCMETQARPILEAIRSASGEGQ